MNFVFDKEVTTILERIIGGADPAYVARNKNPTQEHIIAACWETPDGDIYTGESHLAAWERAWKDRVPGTHDLDPDGICFQDTDEAFKMWHNMYKILNDLSWHDGFLSSTGRFLDRTEAMQVARTSRQLPGAIHNLPKIARLDSCDLSAD